MSRSMVAITLHLTLNGIHILVNEFAPELEVVFAAVVFENGVEDFQSLFAVIALARLVILNCALHSAVIELQDSFDVRLHVD